ncbi:MAG: prolyl oligopeptidase family serine peptidase [Balneolaceae bacterium]|nr:prolyl oligopeptidase family serine peptidase [Balneolaceae bacterium]
MKDLLPSPFRITLLLLATIWFLQPVQAQEKFTFEDVMKFEDIKTPVISGNGEWVAFGVWPELGDGEVRVKRVGSSDALTIERGERPQLTHNGRWAGALVQPPYIEAQNAGRNAPRQSLKLMRTDGGESLELERVRSFSFTNNSEWALVHHYEEEGVSDADGHHSRVGQPATLVRLGNLEQKQLNFVREASADSTSSWLVYTVADTSGAENGIYRIDLSASSPVAERAHGSEHGFYSNLSWDHSNGRIAFTASEMDRDHDYLPGDATIYTWSMSADGPEAAVRPEDAEEGYRLRSNNALTWTNDGARLFYGVMDAEMVALDEYKEESDSLTADNLYDVDRILSEIEGKVWHWDDPQIKTHEKLTWGSRKNRLYRAVLHLESGENVQLGRHEIPSVPPVHNQRYAIGSSDIPYKKLRTWDGIYRDHYLIDLETGEATKFLEKQRFGATLSPNGKFVAWFDGKDWQLKDTESGMVRNLTEDIETPFQQEDNDRPQPDGSYGIAGWLDDDAAVLINDKFDVWQFNTRTSQAISLTDGKGRTEQRVFRIRDLNPDKETFSTRERLLFTMFHDLDKNYGFYEGRIGREGVGRVMEDEKRFNITAFAEHDDAILFTQETYTEYPNLWVASDRRFRNPVQVSRLHEDLTDRFAWGHAELIDWVNMDGKTVQGILYYPGDYDPDETYPVFIYYYERFSQRLYEFNTPVTNHRPNIAQYTSDGYAVFLPDVWFDVPIPGYSATKNLVPGVHKLIEMGIADPDAIGLHGHSWSGYLTAHVVTQTDIFAAAVAGAPVGNMTSAYSGIRWGTGLARQFQYEQTQSRLGVSMWENLAPYIENSPVFFADRINTPLMIQHGDADEAVPWYQSIELYLALRRNGKDSVFLHYYDEPHHLRQFANRLDYAIKMKEYMDHYLKGDPAPSWITDGVPYRGD